MTDKSLIESAKHALDNHIPKSLISDSIELRTLKRKWFQVFGRKTKKEIQWLCIFDQTAIENDIEFGRVAGTEIISDFNSEYGINEMFKKIDIEEKPRVLKNIIYSKPE